MEGRDAMRRSKSNHSMGRKKSQKKTKKSSKSLSKVSELDKDIVILMFLKYIFCMTNFSLSSKIYS
jgi:hypothetical protein